MHNLLFQTQADLSSPVLRRQAATAGLDLKPFDECLAGGGSDQVRLDLADARALGIQGTPTFLIGTVQEDRRVKVAARLTGAVTLERLVRALKTVPGWGEF
jgi:predicted DsbA family dithiol-disulfide isomerase